MPTFDVATLRRRFPALSIEQDGRPIAFFDGPGGTQVPASVIDAVAGYYRESNANTGGPFLTSHRSDAVIAEALGREGIAVWDGDFYATGLIERLGLTGSGGVVRIGLTHYNTADEIDRVVGAIARVAEGVAVA
jgi:selenocysteine lyase/cysteine desulfurase